MRHSTSLSAKEQPSASLILSGASQVFSGKGLTSTQAWRGSVRCPSLDADCKHFCLLCAKAWNHHFCFEKKKERKKNNTHMQRLQKPDLISLVDLILDGHY